MEMTVVDVPEQKRYEGRGQDGLVGYINYQLRGDQVVLTHTETDSRYQGQGAGSGLVRGALDDARARGATVVPLCPFVRSWIERHPDHADIVDQQSREEILG
ncbi:hypothetical protein F4561_005131 [Lipingzhangella halophila]|uniref:N-acetyltransferase domain-containing protein n=1 Tax=Lipingzhangella halophila TaxID=1783352 RepID=A0A7W7RLS1_9ACTN|nr:GNAT family N-acetyltransferase [Lipingzhangella halophila]MBB4934311.1 hypothetical protein [Lipingzhangella halophila]